MNRLSRCCWPGVALVVALGMCGNRLEAQTSPKDAVALYSKGKAAIEKSDFQAALASLEPSYAALPSPNTLLLVAHAKRGLGRKLDAVKDYEQVVSDAEQKVQAGEARYAATSQEARKWSEALAAELGQVTVKVLRAPESAAVLLNGEPLRVERRGDELVATGIWVLPGTVALRVQAAGKDKESSLEVAAGARPDLIVDFGPPEPPPAVAPPRVDAPPESRPIPLGVWVAGGAGVAGLAVFGIFGAMAKSDYDDLQSCAPRCPESERSTADAGKTKQTVANLGLVVGGVGLVTAAGMLLLRPKKQPQSPSVGLLVGPGAVSLRGSF